VDAVANGSQEWLCIKFGWTYGHVTLSGKVFVARPSSAEMESSPSDVGFMEVGITLPLISENSYGVLDGFSGQTASGELSVRMCVQSSNIDALPETLA
jgi:hypothetical protein